MLSLENKIDTADRQKKNYYFFEITSCLSFIVCYLLPKKVTLLYKYVSKTITDRFLLLLKYILIF